MPVPLNTPEQLAESLLIKFQNIAGLEGRKCALVCVEELINDDKFFKSFNECKNHNIFWYKVRQFLLKNENTEDHLWIEIKKYINSFLKEEIISRRLMVRHFIDMDLLIRYSFDSRYYISIIHLYLDHLTKNGFIKETKNEGLYIKVKNCDLSVKEILDL